jgi:hypothetical protein
VVLPSCGLVGVLVRQEVRDCRGPRVCGETQRNAPRTGSVPYFLFVGVSAWSRPMGLPVDTMGDLLEQSRSLAFLIQDATDLPPVARNIHQIAEQSEQMLAAAAGPGVPPGPAPSTYRFLAAQGVDAMDLDPNALDISRTATTAGVEAAALGTAEDLEAFLKAEQWQTFREAVVEANQLVVDEFDGSFWTQGRKQWEVCSSPGPLYRPAHARTHVALLLSSLFFIPCPLSASCAESSWVSEPLCLCSSCCT